VRIVGPQYDEGGGTVLLYPLKQFRHPLVALARPDPQLSLSRVRLEAGPPRSTTQLGGSLGVQFRGHVGHGQILIGNPARRRQDSWENQGSGQP